MGKSGENNKQKGLVLFMEKRIESYVNKLETDQITFAQFLRDLKKELGVSSLVFDTKTDVVEARYGDNNEKVIMSGEQWPKIKETEAINLAEHLVDLKKDWSVLLNDEKYHQELGEFLNKYKLTKVDFNLENDEVKFYSGSNHLVEALDYDNQ